MLRQTHDMCLPKTFANMKINTNSVMGIIMTPIFYMVCLLVVACFVGYNAQKMVMDDYQYDLLNKKMMSANATFTAQQASLRESAELLNVDYEDLWTAIEDENVEKVKSEMEWTIRSASLKGYIVTKMNGEVLASSLDGVMSSDLTDLIPAVRSKAIIQGCDDFVDGQICEYVASIIKNQNGEDIAVSILIAYSAGDGESLQKIKLQNDVEAFLFAGEKCVNSTRKDVDLAKVELSQSVIDSCYMRHVPWLGETLINGEKEYVTCIPFTDFNGVTRGLLMMQSDRTVHDRIIFIVIIFLICAFFGISIMILMLYVRVRSHLAKTIKKLVAEVKVIATGDLTAEIERPKYCDEIITLATSVGEMQRKIREVVEPVVEMSDSIVGSIRQLTKASLNMSNAANQQAASLEEISSSMEQMGANIQQNTDNSIVTNKVADEINRSVGQLGSAANNSYEAIRNIANDVNAINELVMQTNILALNASVEAARAGEQGKGFAVVAKEVGRLADQTHETADGINETATSSISEAETAYHHVVELLPKIEKVVTLIKEITAASIEQNTGVNQVNSAILSLNRVTQENAAGAEEIAASTQELQRMLLDVTKAIEVFKVK